MVLGLKLRRAFSNFQWMKPGVSGFSDTGGERKLEAYAHDKGGSDEGVFRNCALHTWNMCSKPPTKVIATLFFTFLFIYLWAKCLNKLKKYFLLYIYIAFLWYFKFSKNNIKKFIKSPNFKYFEHFLDFIKYLNFFSKILLKLKNAY